MWKDFDLFSVSQRLETNPSISKDSQTSIKKYLLLILITLTTLLTLCHPRYRLKQCWKPSGNLIFSHPQKIKSLKS